MSNEKEVFELMPVRLRCEYHENPLGIDTPKPRFSWELSANSKDFKQSSWCIMVSSSLEDLAQNNGDMWNSGFVKSTQQSQVEYGGRFLTSDSKYYWKVICGFGEDSHFAHGDYAFFVTGLFDCSDWAGHWVKSNDDVSNPLFRKTFNLECLSTDARVYVSGLGYYLIYLNGNKVSDNVLSPGWTEYDERELKDLYYPFDDETSKRVLYNTYDITEYLRIGINVIGIELGNGWYNQTERTSEGKLWYGTPRFILQMNINCIDTSKIVVASDESWVTSDGPVVFNNIFYGEIYDARREKSGWTNNGFNDSKWIFANSAISPKGLLQAQLSPPDKIAEIILPVAIEQPVKGVYIYDMGQNFTGWVRLKVSGRNGLEVKLRFAEELMEDGSLDFSSAGGEEQIQSDTYILNGQGIEEYEPRFTWHGFRYVEVTGYPGEPCLDTLEGKFVHSDVEKTGEFFCSNSLVNTIYKNYIWTQLSNMHGGVPSDCPQRERLGYTGDGQVTAEAAIYCFDMASFYTKWIDDIFDSQNKETGFIPHTAPFSGGGGGPGGWGCACIIMPWVMYLYYGDKKILEKHYQGMKHWFIYLQTIADSDGIIMNEEPGSWCLGDWSTPGEITIPRELVNTFYYCYCAQLMEWISQVLKIHDDKTDYGKLFDSVAKGFNKRFFDNDKGVYSIGKQGCNVFPLALGIVPDESRDEVIGHELHTILADNGGHLDTGMYATPLLFEMLTLNGFVDTAWTMINKRTYPSYGFMIENGATTIWENWEKEVGSRNHPMLGSIIAWFYKYLAGIKADRFYPGFERFSITPTLFEGLTFVKASMKTMKGTIKVEWKRDADSFTLKAVIPAGSTADIYLPAGSPNIVVTESNKTIWENGVVKSLLPGISRCLKNNENIMIEAMSGTYLFCAKHNG